MKIKYILKNIIFFNLKIKKLVVILFFLKMFFNFFHENAERCGSSSESNFNYINGRNKATINNCSLLLVLQLD
jgi:hypothetical protein